MRPRLQLFKGKPPLTVIGFQRENLGTGCLTWLKVLQTLLPYKGITCLQAGCPCGATLVSVVSIVSVVSVLKKLRNYSSTFLMPPAAAGEGKEKEASPESPPGFLAIALRPGDAVPPAKHNSTLCHYISPGPSLPLML